MRTLKLFPICIALLMLALTACEKDAPEVEELEISKTILNNNFNAANQSALTARVAEILRPLTFSVNFESDVLVAQSIEIIDHCCISSINYTFSNNQLQLIIEVNAESPVGTIQLFNMETDEVVEQTLEPAVSNIIRFNDVQYAVEYALLLVF